MADDDHSARAKTSEEPGVGDGDDSNPGGSKAAAVKDRQCQYCHQLFTSSSLGRHLDQYLFKKKPDGIHDVDEIRRIRSSITRRQARTSSGKQDSPERGTGKGQLDQQGVASQERSSRPREGATRMLFNTPTWHATGVINDIPEPSSASEGTGSSRVLTCPPGSGSIGLLDHTNTGTSSSHSDTARALELALREVLDSIKAATSRTRVSTSPFDFELQAQTFPALCLRMLPPPPSLFATRPISSPSFFPLEPPGPNQVEDIQQALHAHIDKWQSDQLTLTNTKQPALGKTGTAPEPAMVNRTAQQYRDLSLRHLELSYQHWMALPPDLQRDTWQLEITRAFAREVERREQLDGQLARVQQEANQLRAQVERLNSCQWPREFAIFPPDMLPLSRDMARELDSKDSIISPSSPRWEYDNVVAKWKRVVMHDKGMGRVGVGHSNNLLLEESSADGRLRSGDDTTTFLRAKSFHPAPTQSPDSSSSVAGQLSSLNPNQQHSSYQLQDVHRTSLVGSQSKRQRLINGLPNDAYMPDGEGNSPLESVNGAMIR
ncbi:hypothetical protein Egran_05467 [Elaphomyces granulatus]|uniref:Uncharacterized protein n=1 Tax=Elaphomyces granulatus TaxID=519963 RepID=A0A232LRW6_9EURO|nr:hypothetical protein Egran_05467 [Elaphomyces granulatus]